MWLVQANALEEEREAEWYFFQGVLASSSPQNHTPSNYVGGIK